MQKTLLLFTFIFSLSNIAQNKKAPVYKQCESVVFSELESCFAQHLKTDFLDIFKVPTDVNKDVFHGKIIVVFSISTSGNYTINYVNSNYKSVKLEVQRVFKNLPTVTPAMYNGRAVESEFILPFYIPLEQNFVTNLAASEIKNTDSDLATIAKKQQNFDANTEFNSGLSIPFSHQQYAIINSFYTKQTNNHTAVKPYIYNEINNYQKVIDYKTSLFKNVSTRLGKKLWNDDLISIKGNDYWIKINPMFDLQLGKDNSDIKYTYNNTRALNIKGGIGKINFSTSFYESQGRFASYLNDYMHYLSGAKGNGVVLGRGVSKIFKNNDFDYPVAEAYISYAANKHFNVQFGNGKNFIGDGYRSLLLSDVASPYTFAKISTNFWKVKYTNIWMWMDDIRVGSFENGSNLRKYMATHHLSINITDKLNLGFFESVITNQRSNPNIDINFLNPIIFYRAVEFSRGSKSGNAIVGLNTKYKLNNATVYGQFVLDEITVKQFFKNNGYWANKFGVQLGFNYYNAFKINNLSIQGEVNLVRPYTYSHKDSELNYSHYNQPLAHPWGSNFAEFVGIVRYNKDRWFGNLKVVTGKKGFDFNTNENYGGNIFLSYANRRNDFNNVFYQGNTAKIFNTDLNVGYIINPTTNLQLFGSLSVRTFRPEKPVSFFQKENTIWFRFGLKTDVFNSYFSL